MWNTLLIYITNMYYIKILLIIILYLIILYINNRVLHILTYYTWNDFTYLFLVKIYICVHHIIYINLFIYLLMHYLFIYWCK